MNKLIRWTWFPVACGLYGFVSAEMGHGFTTPTYWLGLALALVAYIGVGLEDRL